MIEVGAFHTLKSQTATLSDGAAPAFRAFSSWLDTATGATARSAEEAAILLDALVTVTDKLVSYEVGGAGDVVVAAVRKMLGKFSIDAALCGDPSSRAKLARIAKTALDSANSKDMFEALNGLIPVGIYAQAIRSDRDHCAGRLRRAHSFLASFAVAEQDPEWLVYQAARMHLAERRNAARITNRFHQERAQQAETIIAEAILANSVHASFYLGMSLRTLSRLMGLGSTAAESMSTYQQIPRLDSTAFSAGWLACAPVVPGAGQSEVISSLDAEAAAVANAFFTAHPELVLKLLERANNGTVTDYLVSKHFLQTTLSENAICSAVARRARHAAIAVSIRPELAPSLMTSCLPHVARAVLDKTMTETPS